MCRTSMCAGLVEKEYKKVSPLQGNIGCVSRSQENSITVVWDPK